MASLCKRATSGVLGAPIAPVVLDDLATSTGSPYFFGFMMLKLSDSFFFLFGSF